MTYIPAVALQLKSFSSVEEMNHHMNLQYIIIKHSLTKSFDLILHLIKKHACKVAGVCWLKQEKLAKLADVSVKTVERGIQFLKDCGVIKIYHTKRSNGLNGHSYYVLQPYQGEPLIDAEEIVSVEERNVGTVESLQSYESTNPEDDFLEDKLSLSSSKALESSIKKEEEINYNARVESNFNRLHTSKLPLVNVTEEEYHSLIELLFNNQFSEAAAREITVRVLAKNEGAKVAILLRAFAKALLKFRERLAYQHPIYSVVDYFVRLVMEEIKPGFTKGKVNNQREVIDYLEEERRKEVGDWLREFAGRIG